MVRHFDPIEKSSIVLDLFVSFLSDLLDKKRFHGRCEGNNARNTHKPTLNRGHISFANILMKFSISYIPFHLKQTDLQRFRRARATSVVCDSVQRFYL
jgi:hypothetical protein